MNGPAEKSGSSAQDRTISFNMSGEQMEKIMAIRRKLGISTGEVVRRACEVCTEEILRRNPAPYYDRHLTVSLPKDLREKIERLARACDMKISDVVRRACDAYFRRELEAGQEARQAANTVEQQKQVPKNLSADASASGPGFSA
ncbi:MAG: ribbon-helix-helix domain-containing protein [Planctomycetota bacterium]|nr:ribbon-helix-helix domain-containing protein [Planctomycetota bacterium]